MADESNEIPESSQHMSPPGLASSFSNESNGFRWWALALVLLMQSAMALPQINTVMVDGSHPNWGNSNFLRRIIHSLNSEGDPRRVFGLTEFNFDAEQHKIGTEYYSHHGVLGPMLGRVWVGIFGPSIPAIRCFALLWSLAATCLVFVLLCQTTRNLPLNLLLTACYVMLPLKAVYVAAWKYESVTETFILLTAAIAFSPHRWPYRKWMLLGVRLSFTSDGLARVLIHRSSVGIPLPSASRVVGSAVARTYLVCICRRYPYLFRPGVLARFWDRQGIRHLQSSCQRST